MSSNTIEYRTYDISDADMAIIIGELTKRGYRKIVARLNPVCKIDERLVFTVDAFREHIDSTLTDDEEQIVANTPDDEIEKYLGEEFIYEGWATTCRMALDEVLYQHKHGSKS